MTYFDLTIMGLQACKTPSCSSYGTVSNRKLARYVPGIISAGRDFSHYSKQNSSQ